MNAFRLATGICATLLVTACASSPDRFYTLDVLPTGDRPALATPLLHVRLDLTVPSLVDRPEMVMSTPNNGVQILDHERWAVTLSDQVAQTLSRDLERRRADVLVGDRRFDQAASGSAVIKVDIVNLSATRNGPATLEAHWRVVDATAGVDSVGGGAFEVAVAGTDYAALAQSYSKLLGELADKLVAALPIP